MEENKYQRGKIYKIVDNGYNMVYYGSTVKLLCQRMGNHRDLYKKNSLKCLTKTIFDKYGIENCKIELVENYPCNSKEELLKREGYYIKNNDCINKQVAGRTIKEYRDEHKDNMKKYREQNKDKLLEQGKEYYKKHKDKKLEQNKKWMEENKEKRKEYMKQYRLKQKEQII